MWIFVILLCFKVNWKMYMLLKYGYSALSYNMMSYDTRCHFNVRSEADITAWHGTKEPKTPKKWEKKKN